jgi:cell division protein FtsB
MYEKIRNRLNTKQVQQALDPRNIALYIFGVIVLAIAWSSARTVQNNYQLQKQAAALKQQNQVMSLQNGNAYLQNQFYRTNTYLELSARQNLGLALPGEQELVIPQPTAMKYVDPKLAVSAASIHSAPKDTRSKYVRNLESWRDFLLGRTPVGS